MAHLPALAGLALAALLLPSSVSAFANGAPGCVVNIPRIAKMGGSNQDLGYRLRPAAPHYTPGQPLEFVLEGTAPYQGYLGFATSQVNDKVRVGNWVVPPGFKSNKDKCDAQGFLAGPTGAITHANPAMKPPGTRFIWRPEGPCVPVVIEAVVAQSQTRWQVLPPVRLTCAGGPMPPAGGDYFDDGAGKLPEHVDVIGKPPCPKKGAQGGGEHLPAPHPPPYTGGDGHPVDDNAYGPSHPGPAHPAPHPEDYHGGDEMGEHRDHPLGIPPHKRKCKKRRRRRRHPKRKCKPRHRGPFEGADGGHHDRPAPYEGADGGHHDRPMPPPHSDYPVVKPHPEPYEGADGGHHDRPMPPPHSDYPVVKPHPEPYEGADGGHHDRPMPYDGADGGHHSRPRRRRRPRKPCKKPQRPMPPPHHGDDYTGDVIGDHVDVIPQHPPRKPPCPKPVNHVDVIGDHHDKPAYDGGDHVDVVKPAYGGGDHAGDHVDIVKPAYGGGDHAGDHVDVVKPVYEGGNVAGDHVDVIKPVHGGHAPVHPPAGDYFEDGGAAPHNDNGYF